MMRWTMVIIFGVTTLMGCKENDPIDAAASERGAELAVDCRACHSIGSRKNKIGPHLQDIVGRQVSSIKGYDYSDALKAQDFKWSPDSLVEFILDPTTQIPGTKMAYGGIEKSEAADLVEYLRSLQ